MLPWVPTSLRKWEALSPCAHEEREAATYYAWFLPMCHWHQLMALPQWPRPTDLIFLSICGLGRLENARFLNFNKSLTLPTKMQIGKPLSSSRLLARPAPSVLGC